MIEGSFFGKIFLNVYGLVYGLIKESYLFQQLACMDKTLIRCASHSKIIGFLVKKPYVDVNMEDSVLLSRKAKITSKFSVGLHKTYKKFQLWADNSLVFKFISVLVERLDLIICGTVFSISFLPTMPIAVLIIGTIGLFVIRVLINDEHDFIKIPLSVWLISFMFVVLYSGVTSFSLGSSLKSAMMYLLYLLFVFVIVNTISTKEKLFKLVGTLIAGGALVALYGIFQKITGIATNEAWVDTSMFGATSRVYSTFDNPNVLGEYLILMIPISFSLLWSEKNKFYKALTLLCTAIMGLCLIYTQSRGAWLGVLAGLVFFAVVADRRLIVPGVIAIILIPFLAPSVMTRFMSIGNLADSSSNYRLSIILGSIGIIKDYWISGIGLGLEPFALIYPRYSLAAAYALHSHNYYLQLIIETGIAGFIIIFLMMVAYYRNIFHKCVQKSTTKFVRYLLLGIVAGTLAYFVQGMVENIWFNYRVLLIFWVVIATGLGGIVID